MRADVYLTKHHHVASRTRAQQLIAKGLVTLDGQVVAKASDEVDEALEHTVTLGEDMPYVGRGGCKLEAALDAFGLDVTDAWALDIGASTGGFTDCLLRRGAARVYAVDSGVGQLAPSLCADGRVVNIEKCNARYLDAGMLDGAFTDHDGADVVVMDVSFISQTCILPVLPPLLREQGRVVTLIKPQFEVGKQGIGKGGIVKDAAWRKFAVERVFNGATLAGLVPLDVIRSPIEGGDGNVEYLAVFRRADEGEDGTMLARNLLGTLSEEMFRPIKKQKNG